MVIPHTKKVNVSYKMYIELMESFGLILLDVHCARPFYNLVQITPQALYSY